ncbi:MAG: DUF6434 domain-containing protein [Pseudomonadota bacterium]
MDDDWRPDVTTVETECEFQRWYWSVELLKTFCERLDLPADGSKAMLRERVATGLGGREPKKRPKKRPTSRFNWAKETLTPTTPITDNISFGPNMRGFFKKTIGDRFVCHSEFMRWVKEHTGLTLADAVDAWYQIDRARQQPRARRDIDVCNNYLQYLRDIRDANPTLSQQQAQHCWDLKKRRPAQHGLVVYEASDLSLLEMPVETISNRVDAS